MQWKEIRQAYPDQWLIIEAIQAHTEGEQRRLEQIAVLGRCPDAKSVMSIYKTWRRQLPNRELYFVHTGRETLDIRDRRAATLTRWRGYVHTN